MSLETLRNCCKYVHFIYKASMIRVCAILHVIIISVLDFIMVILKSPYLDLVCLNITDWCLHGGSEVYHIRHCTLDL